MVEVNAQNFIKWFSQLNRDSGDLAGGKGANLAEIYNLKLPVPPGFVVTTEAFNLFMTETGVKEKVSEIVEAIEVDSTKELEESAKEIRELIKSVTMPEVLKDQILDAYDDLSVDQDSYKNFQARDALNILKNAAEPAFVAVRSSANAEDLADASFAGQQESFVNVKGKRELIDHVRRVFASLFTARAIYYRKKKGFKESQTAIAVVVQKMIDSDKSGVAFSKTPMGTSQNVLVEAVFGLGDGIVSGAIIPDHYIVSTNLDVVDKKIANKKIAFVRDSSGESKKIQLTPEISERQVLEESEIKRIADYALQLEAHYEKPQDVEFAIESKQIYIVQTRPITTLSLKKEKREIKGEPIVEGLGASPGISSGRVRVVHDLNELDKVKQGDVLVTEMTNPDMVITMQKAAAIVTDEGGMTAHASIVSRELGIPAVVGTGDATSKLKDGDEVTVDGFEGKVYSGKTSEEVKKEILPVVETKTKLKVIVDLPASADRAAKTGIKSIGLTRIEGIIASSEKHPLYYSENKKIEDYETLIYEGLDKIAKNFEEIWIRTSDVRTDEFSSLEGAPEVEANPMLGFHGVRFSLKYQDIFEAELKALMKIAKQGKKVGIILPQVILVDELKKVKDILKELGFLDIKVGIMIETPASVIKIKEFCDEGIDFVSMGTNDLTQYTFAVDRGNEEVQYLYNDVDPAIFSQIRKVIRVCKKAGVESSICGQAGSKHEMVKFLIEEGIDSISVNADAAHEISLFIQGLEQGREMNVGKDVEGEDAQEYGGKEEVREESKGEIKEEVRVEPKLEEVGVVNENTEPELIGESGRSAYPKLENEGANLETEHTVEFEEVDENDDENFEKDLEISEGHGKNEEKVYETFLEEEKEKKDEDKIFHELGIED